MHDLLVREFGRTVSVLRHCGHPPHRVLEECLTLFGERERSNYMPYCHYSACAALFLLYMPGKALWRKFQLVCLPRVTFRSRPPARHSLMRFVLAGCVLLGSWRRRLHSYTRVYTHCRFFKIMRVIRIIWTVVDIILSKLAARQSEEVRQGQQGQQLS